MPARAARAQLASTVARGVVLLAGAARTAKPVRPAHAPDSLGALRLGAKATQKFRGRHAGLDLDLVAGHLGFRHQESSD